MRINLWYYLKKFSSIIFYERSSNQEIMTWEGALADYRLILRT